TASVAVAVIEYVPSVRVVTGVNDQLPLASAVVDPSRTGPDPTSANTLIVAWASAVPTIVGLELFVTPSPTVPESVLVVIPVMTGGFGAVRSDVMLRLAGVLGLEDASIAAPVGIVTVTRPSAVGDTLNVNVWPFMDAKLNAVPLVTWMSL